MSEDLQVQKAARAFIFFFFIEQKDFKFQVSKEIGYKLKGMWYLSFVDSKHLYSYLKLSSSASLWLL